MQYLFDEGAGTPQLKLAGDRHRYLFKVRRHKKGESIHLRNLRDQVLYRYRIEAIDKKEALLSLADQRELRIEAGRSLHIGWCLIDPKSIEKILPALNEIGVAKITFIYCRRSQKNFHVDFGRLEKILLNSSQQCGRSVMMDLNEAESIERFLQKNPDSWMLNFSQKDISAYREKIETIIIGAEGGFSKDESERVDQEYVVGFNTPLILRSESAVCAAAGKLIL